MNRRFADTFFFIALLSERDEAHNRALTYAHDSSAKLVTTRWVLAEFADHHFEQAGFTALLKE
jgi:predicted nucleic acid-binding protein